MVLSDLRRYLNLTFFILTTFYVPLLIAEDTETTTVTSTSKAPVTTSVSESKLVSSFSPMAGSTENSTSLVKGLRSGTPIVITSPSSTPGAPPNSVTFISPTRPMGYGNIRIALSLVKTQLASQGIIQPTPEQLQGALIGTSTGTAGTTTTQQGILQMRASGMGWGQIANSMGVKLGTVMSGKTSVTTTTTTGTVNLGGIKSTSSSGGVTTAAGSQGKHSGTTTAEGAKSSGGSKGITTGQGHGGSASASGGAINATGRKVDGIGSAAGVNKGHSSGGKKP